MARDATVLDDSDSTDSAARTRDNDGKTGLLHRRRYLQLAGAGALAGAAGFGGGVSAEETDYDVMTVGAGQREVVDVDSNETLENLLIDCTANNAQVVIAAHGTNWTIRNVGIRGRVSNNDAIIGVSDRQGNTSRIENVYIGDGATDGHRVGLGIWVAPQHSGHIDIDRVNIQEMGDNSFYCSAPMHSGAGGTVDISNSYSRDSWVSHFRLGEGTVSNCTAVNTSARDDGRGVWAWAPGDVIVEDSHLATGGRHYAIVAGANGRGSSVRVRDTEYDTGFNGGFREVANGNVSLESGNGTNPEDRMPDGCPTSAEEAAAGEGGEAEIEQDDDDDTDRDEHLLVIHGDDSGVTHYEFQAAGAVEPSTDEGATIDDDLVLEDGHVRGTVANWRDAFRFEGDLEQLTLDGPARASIDGTEVDADDVGDAYPNTLEIDGDGEPASFECTVEGAFGLEDDELEDDALVLSGSTVQGSVTESTLEVPFSGQLSDLTFTDGAATVRLNGEEVDPEDVSAKTQLPHVIVIDNTEASDSSVYSFEATGGVVASAFRDGGSIDEDEVTAGRRVRGIVDAWLDAYWFDGRLEDVTLLGDAEIDVRYNVREQ